jgi:DNA-binding LacI/PurR family transcriptional regulator
MEALRAGGKHVRIYNEIKRQLLCGEYRDGDKLPTENEYSARFAVSRPTVTKALNALEEEGFIVRKTGSGSYVRPRAAAPKSRLLGLFIPGLGRGEIFEPICAEIASAAERNGFSLLWSGFEKTDKMHPLSSAAIARRYIDNGASGVFFQPLEHWPGYDEMNRNVVELFDGAGVPIVLVDSDYLRFPRRSRFDLVGLDNFRAGYDAARCFLDGGADRVDFLMRPYSADTVSLRVRGYAAALFDAGIDPDPSWIRTGYPEDEAFVRKIVRGNGADRIVCANDETASSLLATLELLGVAVPGEVGIIGFDDVRYARHLKVPLTTIRQPCEEIGRLAVETMLWRIENPDRPPRTVSVAGTLIPRQSCGRTDADRLSGTT